MEQTIKEQEPRKQEKGAKGHPFVFSYTKAYACIIVASNKHKKLDEKLKSIMTPSGSLWK